MTVQISRDVGITPCITTSHFTTLVRVVLIGYFPAMLAVGFSFWRRSRLVAGFTAVEGCLSGWLTGLSILGTYIQQHQLPGAAGTSLHQQWEVVVFSLSLPFATGIAETREDSRKCRIAMN